MTGITALRKCYSLKQSFKKNIKLALSKMKNNLYSRDKCRKLTCFIEIKDTSKAVSKMPS